MAITTARQRPSSVPALPALAALAALAALSAAGWAWLARPGAMIMGGSIGSMAVPGGSAMGTMAMPGGSAMSMSTGALTPAGSLAHAAEVLAMWTAMAVAMMLPAVAPTLLRLAQAQPGAARRTLAFAAGYLLAWLVFAAAATLLQEGLERAGVVTGGRSPMYAWAVWCSPRSASSSGCR